MDPWTELLANSLIRDQAFCVHFRRYICTHELILIRYLEVSFVMTSESKSEKIENATKSFSYSVEAMAHPLSQNDDMSISDE